jgi:hypothetical protein
MAGGKLSPTRKCVKFALKIANASVIEDDSTASLLLYRLG